MAFLWYLFGIQPKEGREEDEQYERAFSSTFIIAKSRSPLISFDAKWRGSTLTFGKGEYTLLIVLILLGLHDHGYDVCISIVTAINYEGAGRTERAQSHPVRQHHLLDLDRAKLGMQPRMAGPGLHQLRS